MVAKSLIKLIDEAIIPAIALIVAKMLGLVAASKFLDLPFQLAHRGVLQLLPSVQFNTINDYTLAENYSNLAMFAVAVLGTIIVILKAHFLHESHIHPNLQAKLSRLNLEGLIATSYHLYHQAAIWLIFLWLTVGFLIISTLINITYPQITIVAFLITANLSWIFAQDIEKEIEIKDLLYERQ